MKNHTWLKHHKKFTYVVIIVSLISLLLSPLGAIKDQVIDALPSLVVGLAVTETMFIGGLLVMAFVAGYDLGWNPFKWRKHLKSLGGQINNSKSFWFGFWLNTIGAIGSGLVLGYGVIKALPTSSWGLLWLPILDIILTFAVRAALIELHEETS